MLYWAVATANTSWTTNISSNSGVSFRPAADGLCHEGHLEECRKDDLLLQHFHHSWRQHSFCSMRPEIEPDLLKPEA